MKTILCLSFDNLSAFLWCIIDLVFGNSLVYQQITDQRFFFYRCINQKQSKQWQEAYHSIISKVQDVMLIVYKMKLSVQEKFSNASTVL